MAIVAMSVVSRSTILGALWYSPKSVKQTIPRPPLIEINTDISGKTNLLLHLARWSATPRRFESRETRGAAQQLQERAQPLGAARH